MKIHKMTEKPLSLPGCADYFMIHLCSLADVKHEPFHEAMLADYRELSNELYCRHACGMCESACPRSISVNSIMRYVYYFEAKMQERTALAEYAILKSRNAASCSDCDGTCVKACPYGVPIQAKLILAHETLFSS